MAFRRGAVGALAFDALGMGATAIGALAVGALAIGRLRIRRAAMASLKLGEVTIDRLSVRDPAVSPDGARSDDIMESKERIRSWPDESREAASLVIKAHGEPDEATDSQLIWFNAGPWKRIVATKVFYRHDFPAPHIDAVESVIDYRVPPEKFAELAAFDGSVTAERTAGEVSARCHDEQANFLALNLMHDIVTGAKTVEEARAYYTKEFADFRRKQPTPYMEKLRFTPAGRDTADPDMRTLTDHELKQAKQEGELQASG